MECTPTAHWFFYATACVWFATATIYAVVIRKHRAELQALHAEINRDLDSMRGLLGKIQQQKGLDLRD